MTQDERSFSPLFQSFLCSSPTYQLFSRCIGQWVFQWTSYPSSGHLITFSGTWNFSWTMKRTTIHSVCRYVYAGSGLISEQGHTASCVIEFVYDPQGDNWKYLYIPFGADAPLTFQLTCPDAYTALASAPDGRQKVQWIVDESVQRFVMTRFLRDEDGSWRMIGRMAAHKKAIDQ